MNETCLKCTLKLVGAEVCFGCALVKDGERTYLNLLNENKYGLGSGYYSGGIASDKKYYFIRYTFANEATCRYEERSNVIFSHPFDFIKELGENYLLLDYKEITKEEYEKW